MMECYYKLKNRKMFLKIIPYKKQENYFKQLLNKSRTFMCQELHKNTMKLYKTLNKKGKNYIQQKLINVSV